MIKTGCPPWGLPLKISIGPLASNGACSGNEISPAALPFPTRALPQILSACAVRVFCSFETLQVAIPWVSIHRGG